MGTINVTTGKKPLEVSGLSDKIINVIGQTYTVTFKDYDDTILSIHTVVEGGDAFLPPQPLRTGYTFSSWNGNYINVIQDEVVFATYNINYYDVIFYDWDNSILSSQSIPYLGSATAPTSPSRMYYIFDKWVYNNTETTADFNNITRDIEVKAYYVVDTSFYNMNVQYTTLSYGESTYVSITKENTSMPGIASYDWNINSTDLNAYSYYIVGPGSISLEDTNITSTNHTATVTCDFITDDGQSGSLTSSQISLAKAQFTVTFDPMNGDSLYTQTVDYGGTVTPPADPSKIYYNFDGWDDTVYTNITADKTIYAEYLVKISSYSISITDSTVSYGSTSTLTVNKAISSLPNITSYSWSTTDLLVGNYNLSGATTSTASIQSTNTTDFHDSGYIQCSITTSDGASGALSQAMISMLRIAYTVTFLYGDGLSSTDIVYSGADATAPTNTSLDYYTFTGWDTAYTNVSSDLIVNAQYTVDITQFSSLQLSSTTGLNIWTAKFTLTNNNNISVDVDYLITEGRDPNEVTVGTGTTSIAANSSIVITWDNSSTVSNQDINFYYDAKKDGQEFDSGIGTVNVAPFEESTTTA